MSGGNRVCEGRVAIVTSAGHGLGRDHALAFARAGADVVVNDPGPLGPALRVAAEVRALGRRALINGDDVADIGGAARLVAATIDAFGRFDILVNDATLHPPVQPVQPARRADGPSVEWDDVIRVFLRGTFGTTQVAVEHWLERVAANERVDARVITISTPIDGSAGRTNDDIARAGVAGFTMVKAIELARYGITVNAVTPARTRARRAPLAPVVVWLGSPQAADVTGQILTVRDDRILVNDGWGARRATAYGRRWDAALVGDVIPALVADPPQPTDLAPAAQN